MRHDRPPTLTEIRLKEANKNLLDTQTIVTTLTEGGTV